MFYDNTNKTLPIGMNLSSQVLIDNRRLEFSLVNKTKFRTNTYFTNNDGNQPKCKDVFVYEYDVFLKSEKKPIETLESELILRRNKEFENPNPLVDFSESYPTYEPEETEMTQNDFQDSEIIEQAYREILQEDEPEELVNLENKDESEELVQEELEDVNEEIQEEVIENLTEEPVLQKSKRLLKIQQKLEKELEKQKKKEQKAKEKLEKKKSKKQ